MTPLHWDQARECVRRIAAESPRPHEELVPLETAAGRILAVDVFADRPYPPLPRSMRDGFAVRAGNLPGRLKLVGEVRAGQPASRPVEDGECIEIMTGAPVPLGADSILMVEHAHRSDAYIETDRVLRSGDNVNPSGCEACAGERVLDAGTRLDYAHIAVLASVGMQPVPVFKQTRVSIVSTGDELVDVSSRPEAYRIRNSNSHSLAAQVARAGAEVAYSTLAEDTRESLRQIIGTALDRTDILLISGGVSAGKYDLVEEILSEFEAEFFFTRVLIQPGQPAVFGRAQGKLFFGLPGNPISTMVTFELFARLAVELLGGDRCSRLPFHRARLTTPFRHKTGLTRFLPASLNEDGQLTPVSWHGSGDVFAVAKANAFLVAEHDREAWEAGETIRVLPR